MVDGPGNAAYPFRPDPICCVQYDAPRGLTRPSQPGRIRPYRRALLTYVRGPSWRTRGFLSDKRPPDGRRVSEMSTAVKLASRDARSIPFQEASLDIWDKKYRLSAKDGTPLDRTMDDTYKRVARALADVEKEAIREHWYDRFLWALRRGAIPAGRVTSNAGALEHKPATSTINCTVSGTIRDSMDDILGKVHEAGLTLKAGCGIGYEFSTLRPRGAYVSGAGAYTSGPLSFMDIYDK